MTGTALPLENWKISKNCKEVTRAFLFGKEGGGGGEVFFNVYPRGTEGVLGPFLVRSVPPLPAMVIVYGK